MCFPDMYEIGMSNNAMRIIYDILNRFDGVFCDRVFAVAPDFESMLREKRIPLFTLQEHLPLSSLDFLGISIGYELCATNILQILSHKESINYLPSFSKRDTSSGFNLYA